MDLSNNVSCIIIKVEINTVIDYMMNYTSAGKFQTHSMMGEK